MLDGEDGLIIRPSQSLEGTGLGSRSDHRQREAARIRFCPDLRERPSQVACKRRHDPLLDRTFGAPLPGNRWRQPGYSTRRVRLDRWTFGLRQNDLSKRRRRYAAHFGRRARAQRAADFSSRARSGNGLPAGEPAAVADGIGQRRLWPRAPGQHLEAPAYRACARLHSSGRPRRFRGGVSN